MSTFCDELEKGRHCKELPRYQKLLKNIEKWYQDNYQDYAGMLRSEAENLYESINRSLDERTDTLDFAEDLSYNFGAKLSYFIISDTLVKLILSRYSYGPSQEFLDQYGIKVPPVNCPWLRYKCDEMQMVEILAKVLKDNDISYSFDLQALMRDRRDRNDLTHASQQAACLSALRCYNTIRSMLIFLDADCADILSPFPFPDKYENEFDLDQFTAEPCGFDFTNYTTILIVDSVHDIRNDYRRAVANLPWNLVIDLDGCSKSGGLLSCVEHNNIRKESLNLSLVNGFQKSGEKFQMDSTIWYRCGDYQVPSYLPKTALIPSNTCFRQNTTQKGGWGDQAMEVLGPIFIRAELSERPLNIVAVTDDELLVQSLVDFCRTELSDYFLTWVGLSASSSKDITQFWFRRNKEDETQHFRRFVCPTACFFEEFYNYSDNWPVRVSLDSSFSLPGANKELIVIPENIRNKLANYVEPLYDNCETFCTDEDRLKEAFDSSGAPVAWSLIDSQYAVPLKDRKKFNRIVNNIRTILGTKQDEHPHKRLFFLRHQPGIGGTTFARQLAWELHTDYAVLVVKHYESGEIAHLVENLYDNVLGKNEIVLLADETLPRLKELCDDVCRIDRRCILIVSCRLSSSIPQGYPDATREELKILDNDCIRQLKEHFRRASRLDKATLDSKSSSFDQFIAGDMCSPFIIGLYFMEKDFNIDDYIRKALEPLPRNYADALAYIALGDRYNYKNLPESLIKGLLGLQLRDNFFDHAPSANSIIFSNRHDDNVPYYSFKHYLLAQRYLELYNQRYYPDQGDDLKNMLYQLTTSLISGIADLAGRDVLKESYLDFLSYILIQNKADFNYRLSALMDDISRSDSQIMLLKQLADLFLPYADACLEKSEDKVTSLDRTLLRVVSHANAHVGRLYWKDQKHLPEATRRCELAKKYMPDKDPDIYHMEGSVQKEKLAERYAELKEQHEAGTPVTVSQFLELEQSLEEADQNFDNSCQYGSPEYGYPSKLQLYYQYLEFVYVVKEIHSKKDVSLLSSSQQKIKLNFIRTLEEVDTFGELDLEAANLVETVKGRFEGNILFHDPGTLVQFYQNQVDKYAKDQSKISEFNMALRGLIFARINSAKIKNGGTISFRDIANPDQLQKHIEQLLTQSYDVKDYREYSLKSVLYHYWMQLAKVTDTPLEKALDVAIQWREMEDRYASHGLDPKPYYYLRAIYFLLYKAGAKNRISEAKGINSQIQTLVLNKKFDPKRGNLDKIRDILVEGKEMGQLLDVSSCAGDAERMKTLAEAGKAPMVWDAKLGDDVISYRSAIMVVFSPSAWEGEKAFLKIGSRTSNTLSNEQKNHNIRFLAGYSVERLTAISDSARDMDAQEPFDVAEIVRGISGTTYLEKTNTNPSTPPSSSRPIAAQSEKDAPMVKNGTVVHAKILQTREHGKAVSFDAEFTQGGRCFQAEIVDVTGPRRQQLQKMQGTGRTIDVRIIKYNAASGVYTLKV